MPEGHTIHRLARDHAALLVGRAPMLHSPQGRFSDGAARLSGRTVTGIEAYGKHLFYAFAEDLLLHVHLGLYGSWTGGFGVPPPPRGALRLRMTCDRAWLDLRGPTACEVVTPQDRDLVLARLGPDPLLPSSDAVRAWERTSRSKTPIGQLLMDQSVLAGVGNVYRAESLFRARIAPRRPGHDVDRPTWDGLWSDLVRLMRSGVKAGRIITTAPEHRPRRGGPVDPADAHYVYRRAGLPCRLCGVPVASSVMAGRNVFWCPSCQSD
ncbi:MAG: Fpg/Nei family DNA glycosylase [Actinomycetota bacterium]|nr:Fpg/Nei family DNA glycosylase [Actinomycetota bacterium]